MHLIVIIDLFNSEDTIKIKGALKLKVQDTIKIIVLKSCNILKNIESI